MSKVVVGYPVGGSVTLPFHASMLRLLSHEIGKDDRSRLLRRVTHASGLYVGDNRTLLAQRFMAAGDADWLLQIDTDIEFPPTIIETLMGWTAGDRKIVAASVPLGQFPTCAFSLTDAPGVWDPIPCLPLEPIKVDGVATAIIMIHRDAFEGIAKQHGQTWFHHIYLPKSKAGTDPVDFEYLSQGEDLAFSVRAGNAGFGIWCGHIPGLKHYKTRPLTHDDERFDSLDSAMGELVREA